MSTRQTPDTNRSLDGSNPLIMASWNVCGCRTISKRNEIDYVLNCRGVAIALLQEANIDASRLTTSNYVWHTGSICLNRKRNLAILLSKWHNVVLHSIRSEGPFVLCADISYTSDLLTRRLVIVNVHAPNKSTATYLTRIGTLLGQFPKQHCLMAGDFNSHLSYTDSSEAERKLMGKTSCHDKTNASGEQLKFFILRHDLAVRSMQTDKSLLWTWTNGATCSQIDHVLTPVVSSYFVRNLKGRKIETVSTDHKLLTWSIVPNRRSTFPKNRSAAKRFKNTPPPTHQEVSMLQEPSVQKLYHEALTCADNVLDSSKSVTEQWGGILRKTKTAVQKALQKRGRLPENRSCRRLLSLICKYRFWMSWKPSLKISKKLADVTASYHRKLKELEEEKCVQFFRTLEKFPVGVRINRTHKYLKQYRSQCIKARHTTVSLKDWHNLSSDTEDGLPELVPNVDDRDLPSGPTLADIQRILGRMHNGKTPGHDRLMTEFLKYADETTVRQLQQVMVKVWTTNQLPASWKHNLLIPIPKRRNPTTVSHYRRICLSSTGYKIYAMWVLEKLQRYVGDLGCHQAAFLPERSTSDHLYVVQRILQEKWNGGIPVGIMSLDLEKAFDRVDLKCLPAILRGKFCSSVILVLQHRCLFQRKVFQTALSIVW